MRRLWTRLLVCLLCLALLCTGVFAGETTLVLRFRPIGEGLFAVDSLYGVEARYQNGSTIYCSELVSRFYEQIYGITVLVGEGPIVRDTDTYWFETTDTPQAGDVAYAAPARRGKGYAHYALVKYADEDSETVTLIEQNWSWNGGAAYERTIPYSDDCYAFYTLRCASGTPKKNLPVEDTVSPWAKDYVARADELGVSEGLAGGYRRAITRGVLARLCVNAAETAGWKVDQTNPYGAACALGIMSQDENGEFAPWQTVTRASAAVVLTRLLDCIGRAPSVSERVLSAYSDADAIPSWARSAAAVMTATGLMQSTDDAFRPSDTISTEEILALLVRMLENPTPADLSTAVSVDAEQSAPAAARSAGQVIASGSAVSRLLSRSAS